MMCSNFDAADIEGVIVISLNEQPPEHIIRKILDVENLPNPIVERDCIKGYKWNVETKYYLATVNLYSIQEKTDFDSEFCDKIQAVVFYFSVEEPSSFEDVLSWMPLLKNITPEVQLLVCDSCDCDETSRKKILNWCVENEFELIELNPSEETDDEDDGICSRSKGFGRVIEALQSRTWSNLVMKRESKEQIQLIKEFNDSAREKPADKSEDIVLDDEEDMSYKELLRHVLGDSDELDSLDGSDELRGLEDIFSRFASMKEKASRLSGEERKKYAEKVAIHFWKAMGGDDDEIEGLDDD